MSFVGQNGFEPRGVEMLAESVGEKDSGRQKSEGCGDEPRGREASVGRCLDLASGVAEPSQGEVGVPAFSKIVSPVE
jgi:hypothetical protein